MRALLVLVLMCASARAQSKQPWADGVAENDQTEAQVLFADANKLFAQEAHGPALEKYAKAIALWDHPLIRFNMAVTLVRLDKFLEAAEAIDKALRYGQDPFPTPEQFRQALDYQKLIGGRVGEVDVRCAQPGVQLTLDGKQWGTCPSTQRQRVLAGEHVIVGEAKDFMTRSQRFVVTGGKTASVRVELERISEVARYEYPVKRWIPWVVAGGGAVIGFSGLAVWFAGRSQLDDFKENFARDCPTGCDLDDKPALRDQKASALFKGTLGVSMMVAGGAVVAGGVVWAFAFNKPRRVLPVVEASPTGVTAKVGWQF